MSVRMNFMLLPRFSGGDFFSRIKGNLIKKLSIIDYVFPTPHLPFTTT
jgi:hypothetical protein